MRYRGSRRRPLTRARIAAATDAMFELGRVSTREVGEKARRGVREQGSDSRHAVSGR